MFEVIETNARFLLIGSYPNGPLGGLALTLILSLLGLALAFPLGLMLALCRIAHCQWYICVRHARHPTGYADFLELLPGATSDRACRQCIHRLVGDIGAVSVGLSL